MNMTTLVTGATGYIGTHLVERLLSRGRSVRVIARRNGQGRSEQAQRLLRRPGVHVFEGDLTDAPSLGEAMRGVDIVYHLAWQSNRPTKLDGAPNTNDELVRANVDGTENLLGLSARGGVERFIYTSTVAVYGDSSVPGRWPIREDDALVRDYPVEGFFQRDYIEPKYITEQMIRGAGDRHGLPYVILRPSIVYGPGAQFAEVWVRHALSALRRPAVVEVAQLIHVRDMVDALLLAESEPGALDEVFNVAGPEIATPSQLQAMILRAAFRTRGNRTYGLRFRRTDRHRPQRLRYDLSKAAAHLHFVPNVSLREGIDEMVEAVLGERSPAGRRPARRIVGWRRGQYAAAEPPPISQHVGRGRSPDRRSSLSNLLAGYYERLLSQDLLGDYYDYSDFWNFGLWTEDTKSQKEACENLMEELLAFIPEKKGTILDVACGKGATTRHLLRYYAPEDVTGINISEEQLKRCRENAPGCTFLQMNAAALAFPDASFDNIICVEAACHFDTRADFLREACRVLTPGGRLVFSDAVLRPESHGQPAENYVRSTAVYENVCLRAGFDAVFVADVTEECWGGFSDHLLAYAREKWVSGEFGRRELGGIRRWLGTLAAKLYVIGWCEKGPASDT